MASRNISSAMKSIYGTGNFNPRSFEHKPKKSGKALYLWGLVLFLFAMVAVVLGGMYLFGRTPESFTGQRVSFELIGKKSPETANSVPYTLRITNNEEVALEALELYIDWPDEGSGREAGIAHFISADRQAESEANNTWKLGGLGAGASIDFQFTARFGGRAGTAVVIPFSLSFQPESFTSTYTATYEEAVTLGDPTISLDISGPGVAAEGSEVLFVVRASGETLAQENAAEVFLDLDIPAALSIITLSPAPAEEGGRRWPLSSLAKNGDAYELSITGGVGAPSGSSAVISASLGRGDSSEPLLTASKEISIQNASVSVIVSGTPASGQKLQWGERIDYEATLKNTGEYVMRGVLVRLKMPSESLWDSASLNIQNGGFYESGSVFWDTATTPALDSLRPDASAALRLSLTTAKRPPRGFAGVPRLVAGAEVKAKLGDQEVSVVSEEHLINILADIDFDIMGLYTSPEGAVLGSGPHPPLPGQETVYVMQWNIGPTTSGLRDLTLAVRLPSPVSWKDDTSLAVGEISFDPGTRNVVWKASRVPALELPIEVRFKIGVTPTSALSDSAALLERSEFKVVDDAAGEAMELFLNGVTLGNIE
ncbi:MAG: hypothetical protein HYT31_03865 [Parcubacteria group bacterium]|nr:hypothetical protein [Parcubacteria group bacterium]